MMDQAVTRAAGATPSTKPPAGVTPRSWSILLTSANHGTVGPLGSTFSHAGEHHERVVVVEVPAGAGAPSDEVNLVLRAAAAAQDEPEIFPDWISYDAIEHTLTMHGVVYAAELFKTLGIAPVGESFTIAARNNGVLTLSRAPVAAHAGQVAPAEENLTEDQKWLLESAEMVRSGGYPDLASKIRAACKATVSGGQVAVPEGWKMVPVEPTDDMAVAFAEQWFSKVRCIDDCELEDCYRAMLAAAPSAPAVAQQAPAQAAPAESIECWSHNEEDFNAKSLGELIDDHELEPGATVWVGEAVHPEPKSLFSTDWLIENMGEAAYDIAGEHAGEDYPNVSDEQVAELEALIVGWIAKCAPPNFWTVKNVRPYVLTAEDCGAQASTAGERQPEGGAA